MFLSDPDAVKQVFTGDPRVLHAGEAQRVLRPVLGHHSVLLLDEAPHMAPAQAACCRPSTASACSATAS